MIGLAIILGFVTVVTGCGLMIREIVVRQWEKKDMEKRSKK